MTWTGLAVAALLCARAASGGAIAPTPAEVDSLTTIDAAPVRGQVDLAFGSAASLADLVAIATDPSQDLGLQIRAIRTLPQYCDAPMCPGSAHDALVAIVNGYAMRLPGPLPAQDVLRLRAAIEALGATQSGLPDDVTLLTSTPLLHHPSRDVEVSAVHALRDLCSAGQCQPMTCAEAGNEIRALRSPSGDSQLDNAVNAALQDLAPCDQ